MLNANLKTQLTAYLEKVVQPIEPVASLDDRVASVEMLGLLQEIASLPSRITVIERRGDDERKPSFRINRIGTDIGVRLAGIPLGHEFSFLVLALLQVGGHPSKAAADVIEQVKNLDCDYHFETYFSLSCQKCPDVVQALNLMAILNPKIRHVAINGSLFRDEVNERQVLAVPSIFLNGNPFAQGRMELPEILAKIDTGAIAREATKLDAKGTFDVLIVGGGPAGAAAAVYAARKGIVTGIAAERFGGQVLDTMGIENYISIKATDGPHFATALELHVKAYDVDLMNLQRAESLLPGDLIEVKLNSGATLKSRTMILATGARWRNMNVPGKTELRADAVMQRKRNRLPNVTVITNAQTTEVVGDGSKVQGLIYKNRATEAVHTLPLEGVFVQIGLLPNTDWLKGTVALSKHGEIVVDSHGRTNVPGVFAAGDATTTPFKQMVIAAGEGSKAALSAFDYLIRTTAPVA